MSDVEWMDGDEAKLRKMYAYSLRAHVRYQDGRHSEAPALIFADADFEVGDGNMCLHEDGKRCNEPAIVYVRADALLDCKDALASLEAERDRLREALEQYAGATDAWGIKYEPIDDKGSVARAALKETDT